jgi:hypothetical protein
MEVKGLVQKEAKSPDKSQDSWPGPGLPLFPWTQCCHSHISFQLIQQMTDGIYILSHDAKVLVASQR